MGWGMGETFEPSKTTLPAPWVFGVIMVPLGVYLGFITTALPFLLEKAGVSVERIASMAALLQLPGMLLFLWTPVVDIKLRRRTWLMLGAAGAGLCLAGAGPLLGASRVASLTAVLIAGGVAVALVPAGCGGLMVRMLQPTAQSKASGWNQAGQLGGGAVGAAMVLWLAKQVPIGWACLGAALLAAVPALLALTIPEPAPLASAWFRGRLVEIGREGTALLRCSKRRWSALLLVAPCCTAAAQGLLPALASHYGVDGTGVIWINGLGGGGVLALGALCSTVIPAAWDQRLMYAGGGLANALATIVLLASNRPSVFVTGTLLYLLTTGFCWARFVAMSLEVIGPAVSDTSTWYGILTSAGTLPLALMLWFDGQGFRRFGVHGLLWTDAAPNFLIFAIVALAFLTGRSTGAVAISVREQALFPPTVTGSDPHNRIETTSTHG